MSPFVGNAASLAACVCLVACEVASGVGLSLTSGSVSHRTSRLRASSNVTGMSWQTSLVLDAKPIRIIRSGSGSQQSENNGPKMSDDQCGVTTKVHSGTNKWERCPDACPFYVQDRTDEDFCTFACVTKSECSRYHPETPIGDEALGVCRSCIVDSCEKCDNSVAEDRCATCQAGYYLQDGQCHFKFGGTWVTCVKYGVLAILVFALIWILHFAFRSSINDEVLNHAVEFRDQQMLRMPKDAEGKRDLWPLSTNLMSAQVAGPGMSLHFSFQAAVIIWAAFVALVWMCFAQFVDADLWILGTRAFGTPRSNCILVAWGYETQQRLMWTKVAFLWIVYIGSFLMCMAYGVYQLRSFQDIDYQHKTMKDFVGMITGLPKLPGTRDVEGDLKAHLERITDTKVVGVSVAWDYQEQEDAVTKALAADLQEQEVKHVGPPQSPRIPEMNPVSKFFYTFEQHIFGLGPEDDNAESAEEDEETPIGQLLKDLNTSPRAFVVFETQEGRDKAITAIGGGFAYEGEEGLTMEEISAEPATVQWVNFGHSSTQEKVLKLLAGFGFIALACLVWAVVFYSPYAYYILTFNYENGRAPGFEVGLAFSMIVVVGNAIMYETCARLSDWIGFRFKDDREACYMILYTVACMFNVALDFVTTYMQVEMMLEGLGFRTYFGVPFQDVPTFTGKFETYGMQRSLAENTFAYAFPSSYLIPFLIEPIPSVFLPLFQGKWTIKGHPEVQGISAEEAVASAPMEMGRYADILLNMILGILIFYFPGGFTWKLFLGLAGSHVYIYAFDHWRVLRAIPSCTFASFDIEWYCQALLAPILGIVAACIAFKSNCEPGYHCVEGMPIVGLCTMAWLVHVMLHLAALYHIVPKFSKPPPEVDPAADETFETLAQKLPSSWFTSNPINCLRSKHHYGQSPPCSYFVLGKEKYMQVNPKIGCFFEQEK